MYEKSSLISKWAKENDDKDADNKNEQHKDKD